MPTIGNLQTMSNRVSSDQLEALLDFLNEHPLLARGVGLGSRSKEAVEKQWNDLAHKLNAFGSGSAKSGERWKKYWADLKHKSKTRVAKRRRDTLGTGGGPGSQDDLTEVDKKVLAIIGEQAVFGDSEHRIPLSYIKAETQQPSNNIVSMEVVFPHDEIEILPVVSSSPMVNSPSRKGHTTQVYTDNVEIGPSTSTHQNIADSDFDNPVSQQLPQAFQTQQAPRGGAVSPVSRPIVNRPRHRSNRPDNNTTISSKITPEWVKELEIRRVEAKTKLANAAVIMAESSRLQAETAHAQADSMRVLLELVRRQSNDIRALLEMTRAAYQNQQQLTCLISV